VSQTPIADGNAGLVQFLQGGPHHACPGENDFCPLWLQTDDGAPRIGVPRSIQVNLSVDLVAGDDCALDSRRVIFDEAKSHGSDVGHGAAHSDEQIR